MARVLPKWRNSIRLQLILTNVLALTLLLIGLAVIIRLTVRSTMLLSVDRELDGHVHRLVDPSPRFREIMAREMRDSESPDRGARLRGPDRGGEPRDRDLPQGRRDGPGSPGGGPGGTNGSGGSGGPSNRTPPRDTNPYRLRIYALDGKPLEPPGDTPMNWDPAAVKRAGKGRVVYSTVRVGAVSVRVLTRPFPAHGAALGVVQAPYDLTDVDRAVGWLDRALLLMSPVALLFAGLSGAFLTDRMLVRVRAMSKATERIGAEDLSERLPVAGSDEFSRLASTFNGLLGRLETAFRAQERLIEMQRRFTADASHELKTPLTTIKGTASMALYAPPSDEMYQQSLKEIDRAAGTMSLLVQDLLLLARTDDGQAGREPIEMLLSEVLERAMPPRTPGVPMAPVTLTTTDDSLTVFGNETELMRLFRNLLDNAVRYTEPEGKVTVSAHREGQFAVVTISDNGPGIPTEHLAHLGERFYRVDAARARPDGGTGLGISISIGIAEAHGGRVSFESTVGVGTVAKVLLPLPAGGG